MAIRENAKQLQMPLPEHYFELLEDLSRELFSCKRNELIQSIIADYFARGCPSKLSKIPKTEEIAAVQQLINKSKSPAFPVATSPSPTYRQPETDDSYTEPEPEIQYPLEPIKFGYNFDSEFEVGKPVPCDYFIHHPDGVLEHQANRHRNFQKYADRGHNPYYPDPAAQLARHGQEVWRIEINAVWRYYQHAPEGIFMCDWNGYSYYDYQKIGLPAEEYPVVAHNFREDVLEAVRLAVSFNAGNFLFIQPVFTNDYQYFNDPEFTFYS